jgi:filamentous hemagglutinin family protein
MMALRDPSAPVLRTLLLTSVAGAGLMVGMPAYANPNGGQVVAGAATITGTGTSNVTVTQTTKKAIIDWSSFSIAQGETTTFNQLGKDSIALNRVTGGDISQIFGSLNANGQVYLINPNGVVFGAGARVDVGGLVATTANISNDAFMAGGTLRFGQAGKADAQIVNEGYINVRDAGIAAFVAPRVRNNGTITAHAGKVAFGGAEAFTLDLNGDNLIRFQVGDEVKSSKLNPDGSSAGALVEVGGVVDVRGGTLQLTASAARGVINQSVKVTGFVPAATATVNPDGSVSLRGETPATTTPAPPATTTPATTLAPPPPADMARTITNSSLGDVGFGDLADTNTNTSISTPTSTPVSVPTDTVPGTPGAVLTAATINIQADGEIEIGKGATLDLSAVTNKTVNGGTLTIAADRAVLDGAINLDGKDKGGSADVLGREWVSFGSTLSASGVKAGGSVTVESGGGLSLAGRISVNARDGRAGDVFIHAVGRAVDTQDTFIDATGLHGGTISYTSDSQIIASGAFRASGTLGFGGKIDMTAPRLDLFSSQFYAQGGIAGGTIRIGGEYQGGKDLVANGETDELTNAKKLTATDGVTIDVSSTALRGRGGDIVVWSDDKTTFFGTVKSQGGIIAGNGGNIEVSGADTLLYRGTVETARDGQRGGTLLLDPKNITIADQGASQLSLVLDAFSSALPRPAGPKVEAGDQFGAAVSLDGNRLAVGASNDDGATNGTTGAGAVYLFTFSDAAFGKPSLTGILGAGYTGGKNLSISSLEAYDSFGSGVSLDGNRLAVGAQGDDGAVNTNANHGAIYLFTFADAAFSAPTQVGIIGSDYSGGRNFAVANLGSDDIFGRAISLDGARLAVGAAADDGFTNGQTDSGAVYLFTFADLAFNAPQLSAILGNGYTGGQNLSVAGAANSQFFGYSVSLSGNRLAVGAHYDDGVLNNTNGAGAVYLFTFANETFASVNQSGIIGLGYTGPSSHAVEGLGTNDRFGAAISLDENRLAVGTFRDNRSTVFPADTGVVYLFSFADAVFSSPKLEGIIGADYTGGKNFDVDNLTTTDLFGYSLSLDGNRLAVGAFYDDGVNRTETNAGAVYLFTFDDAAFANPNLVSIMGAGYSGGNNLSVNGLKAAEEFGASVSLDGNRLAVGAIYDSGFNDTAPNSGAVYLFTFADSEFTAPKLVATIGVGYTGGKNYSPTGLAASDTFGTSVSLAGNRLAVGAVGDDGAIDGTSSAGAVYLFTFSDSAFSSPNLAATIGKDYSGGRNYNVSSLDPADFFGFSVSLSGNRLAVGALRDDGASNSAIDVGAVYLFTFANSNFDGATLAGILGKGYSGANNYDVTALGNYDDFGVSVSLDGNRLAAGARLDAGATNAVGDAGAVHLFTFADSAFTTPTLVGSIGVGYSGASSASVAIDVSDTFGYSVSLSGNRLAVGAPNDDGFGNLASDTGALYLFTFADAAFANPTLVGQIGVGYTGGKSYNLSSLESSDWLGVSVSIDGNRLATGARRDDGAANSATNSGAVYLFTFADATLTAPKLAGTLGVGYGDSKTLSVTNISAGDQFGTNVSLDGNRLAIGSYQDDGAGKVAPDSGAVYLFTFADMAFASPTLTAIIGKGYSGGSNYNLTALEAGDRFGRSVSLDGNRLAVGAYYDAGAGNVAAVSGAVYLFTFADASFKTPNLAATIGRNYSGGNNYNLATLDVFDLFGISVSLDGNRLAIGSFLDDGVDNLSADAGAVYLFSFADSAFTTPNLVATFGKGYSGGKNVNVANLDAGEWLGIGVSLDGNRLAVGAALDLGAGNAAGQIGAVYLFSFGDNNFATPNLEAIIGRGYSGGKNYNMPTLPGSGLFGEAVSLDGNRLAVGSPQASTVHLFTFADSAFNSPSLAATFGNGYVGGNNYNLTTLDAGDQFGQSVSLDGNRLVATAYYDDGFANTSTDSGAVYLFTFADAAFSNPSLAGILGAGYGGQKSLSVGQLATSDQFGRAVSLNGNRLAIGAVDDDGFGNASTNSGAVYLFTFADAAFTAPTLASIIGLGYTGGKNFSVTNLGNDDSFGGAVALDGNRLIVGAARDDGVANTVNNAGAVYLFTFADLAFSAPSLVGIIGSGYSGGGNFAMPALEVNDHFGVSVSLDGNRIAVGAFADYGAGNIVPASGAVYLFTFADANFTSPTIASIIGAGYSGGNNLSMPGLQLADWFGFSVALDGNRLAVGAQQDDGAADTFTGSGAVYLFTFADAAFTAPTLVGTIGKGYSGAKSFSLAALEATDSFGFSVSLDGNRLAVGAHYDDGASPIIVDGGGVYLFTFSDAAFSSPSLAATIGSTYVGGNNLAVSRISQSDIFGSSVSLDGNRLAVGSGYDDAANVLYSGAGSVYLFTFDTPNFAGGRLQGSIGAGSTVYSGYAGFDMSRASTLEADDRFGIRVSLDGSRLAVGAQQDDGAANNVADAGAVYLFTFADLAFSTPTLAGIIGKGYSGGNNYHLGALEAGDLFGRFVSLDGNRLAVGAPNDDGAGNSLSNSGAVYLFTFADGAFSNPTLAATLGKNYAGGINYNLSTLDVGDGFGISVSLDGNRLAVGASSDDGAANAHLDVGAVYLFSFSDSAFNGATLEATIGRGYTGGKNVDFAALDPGDIFGLSVSLDGTRLAVGAPNDDGVANGDVNVGAIRLFTFADTNFNGTTLVGTLGKGYVGPNDYNLSWLETFDFLSPVSLDGNRLVVGANNDDGPGNISADTGAVYFFTFEDSALTRPSLTATFGKGYSGGENFDLPAIDNADYFGVSVSLDGNRLAVGAFGHDGRDNAIFNSGAVYLFTLGAQPSDSIYAGRPGDDITITTGAIARILNSGTALTLQANNDITVNNAIAVNNPSGNGGALTLAAGRSILLNANIVSDNGTVSLIANDHLANGVVDAYRDAGLAQIVFGAGVSIDAGNGIVNLLLRSGLGKTNRTSGNIILGSVTASSMGIVNEGATAGSGIVLNPGTVLTASGAGNAIILSGDIFTNNAGAGAFNLTGGGRALVYSNDWAADTRGGLFGNNLYNRTFAGNAPASITQTGNLFIYERQPILTFTPQGASRQYGLANPAFVAALTGLVNGDSAGYAYSGAPTVTTLATALSNVGSYDITAALGTLASDVGYGFAFGTPGSLTITKALLTVQADDKTREYGLTNPTLTSTITGYRNADDETVISGLTLATLGTQTSNVGTYAINASGALATNYDFVYNPGTLTITKALLTVQADDKSRQYGLVNPTLTSTITGYRNADDASVISGLTLATLGTQASNVGTYAIDASGASAANYDFVYNPGTLTITKALLTVQADDKSREYGIANPTLTSTITGYRNADDASVISGLTLATLGTQTSNVGTYAINASGASATNYDFVYNPGTLTITKALLTVQADDKSRQYGLVNPTLTSTITGYRNADDASVISGLTLATLGTQASNVGTYAIDASGASAANYDFVYNPGTLTITKALLTVQADDKSRQYGLTNPTLTSTITGYRNADDETVISGLTLATLGTQASNVGTYAIDASGASATNYDFVYSPGTLTITKALLTVQADDKTRQYGLANPTLTSTITGYRNADDETVISGLTLATLGTQASNVGTYAIDASGASATNYDFVYNPGTLTITKALLTVQADDKTRQYGLANPTLTSTITGYRNADDASVISGLTLATLGTQASNVGTYTITASGASATNYDFVYNPGTLTITKALLTVQADDKTRQYGLANPTLTSTITGYRNADDETMISGLTLATLGTQASNVGTYAIDASGASATNYDFVYSPGTLTITKALLTVQADDKTRQYGLANPTLTSTITGYRNADDETVISGLTLATLGTQASNVGTYAIDASGASATNYDFVYSPGTLTITKALLTVQADDKSRQYGLANPTLTSTITGYRNADDETVISGLTLATLGTQASNVGTYAIDASGASATNYDFVYNPGTLTITKALLTVQADDKSREYGLANPTLTSTITGYRNADDETVISGLTLATLGTQASNVGTYAIDASGASATNYDFVYNPGALTITKALLTVQADDKSREYGLANPTLTSTITGYRNADDASVISGLTVATLGTQASNVGTYAIDASGASATNYDFVYNPGTLTITKALLTVQADDKTRQYGLANPTLTSTITGYRNGDDASVVSGLTLATTGTQASNVGTYAIDATGASATNYDFVYNPGTLTITTALLTVQADDKTRQYGLANPTLTSTITGYRNGDDASVVTGLTLATAATQASDVGMFDIMASGASATNYDFAFNSGKLTITTAPSTLPIARTSALPANDNPIFAEQAPDRSTVLADAFYTKPPSQGPTSIPVAQTSGQVQYSVRLGVEAAYVSPLPLASWR